MRPATTEHNKAKTKVDITDDQAQALLLQSVPRYERALKAKNDATAEFIKECKRIKGDGVSIDDVKTAIKLKTPEGEAALKAKLEAEVRVARWMSASLGTQFNLFDDGDSNSFQAGKEVGLAGEPAKVPTGRDPEEWMRGWHEGQRLKISGIRTFQGERGADDLETAPGDELDESAEGAEPPDLEPMGAEPAEPLAPGSPEPDEF